MIDTATIDFQATQLNSVSSEALLLDHPAYTVAAQFASPVEMDAHSGDFCTTTLMKTLPPSTTVVNSRSDLPTYRVDPNFLSHINIKPDIFGYQVQYSIEMLQKDPLARGADIFQSAIIKSTLGRCSTCILQTHEQLCYKTYFSSKATFVCSKSNNVSMIETADINKLFQLISSNTMPITDGEQMSEAIGSANLNNAYVLMTDAYTAQVISSLPNVRFIPVNNYSTFYKGTPYRFQYEIGAILNGAIRLISIPQMSFNNAIKVNSVDAVQSILIGTMSLLGCRMNYKTADKRLATISSIGARRNPGTILPLYISIYWVTKCAYALLKDGAAIRIISQQ